MYCVVDFGVNYVHLLKRNLKQICVSELLDFIFDATSHLRSVEFLFVAENLCREVCTFFMSSVCVGSVISSLKFEERNKLRFKCTVSNNKVLND